MKITKVRRVYRHAGEPDAVRLDLIASETAAGDGPEETCSIRLHESANAEVFAFLVSCAPSEFATDADAGPVHDIS
jgi:hypothetical protein